MRKPPTNKTGKPYCNCLPPLTYASRPKTSTRTAWLVAATDTQVKLEDDGEIFTFCRDEIKKLWQLREPNRTKQRIFSGICLTAVMLAGLVIGTGLGFRQCGRSCNEEKVGAMAAIIGLPVAGGVIGYKLAGNGKPGLVYAVP